MGNPYGDVELTPKGMRALAHPVRLAILSHLQRHGPATATTLAPVAGCSPSVASWHLRHLAEHGLIRDADVESDGRQRWWEAASRGVRITPQSDDAGRAAARMLSRVLMEDSEEVPREWARTVEPLLEDAWLDAAGQANTRIIATADEVAAIEAEIERILAPYVMRKDTGERPAGARGVRVLRYTLPEGPEPDGDPEPWAGDNAETRAGGDEARAGGDEARAGGDHGPGAPGRAES